MPRNCASATDLPEIVLASGSRHRAAQMACLGLPYTTCAPQVDETPLPGETVRDLVVRLGLLKADAVVGRLAEHDAPRRLVIASDQSAAVDVDGTLHRLAKPGTTAQAEEQLQRLSGRDVAFLTSLVVVDSASGPDADQTACAPLVSVDETRVRFRTLDAAEIRRYIAADDVLDCAGAFRVESLGISLFEHIRSEDPTALVGLPLISLCASLRACGVTIP